VTGTSLNPDDIRAAAETHRELGPDYQSAVVDSFLEKVTREIDARVDARLASNLLQSAQFNNGNQANQPAVRQSRERGPFALGVISLVASIPLTGIALAQNHGDGGGAALIVIWLGIAIINVAYALSTRNTPRH
jgi:hypothetical protein